MPQVRKSEEECLSLSYQLELISGQSQDAQAKLVEFRELQQALALLRDERNMLSRKLDEMALKHQYELQSAEQAGKTDLAAARQELVMALARTEELKEKIRQAERAERLVDEQARTVDDLKRELQRKAQELQDAVVEKRALQAQWTGASSNGDKIAAAAERNEALQLKMNELRSEVDRAKSDSERSKSDLRSQLTRLTSESDQLRADARKLKADNDDLLVKLEHAERQARQGAENVLQGAVQRHEFNTAKLEAKLEGSTRECEMLKARVDETKAEISKKTLELQSSAGASGAEVASLRTEVGTLKSENALLKGELGALKQEASSAQKEASSLRHEAPLLKEEVATLKRQLASAGAPAPKQEDDPALKQEVMALKQENESLKQARASPSRSASFVRCLTQCGASSNSPAGLPRSLLGSVPRRTHRSSSSSLEPSAAWGADDVVAGRSWGSVFRTRRM